MSENYFETFLDLVNRTRQAQRDYQAYREKDTLQSKVKLESQVDQFIDSHLTSNYYDTPIKKDAIQ